MLTLQGLGGVYDEIFLPLHGAHQAQNAAVALAAVEAFLGAGADRQLDVERGPRGLRRHVARRAGWSGSAPRRRSCSTRAHNPHGMAATVTALQEEFAFSRLVAVVGGARPTRTSPGMLELLEPVVDAVVVHPQHARRGRCRSTSWPSSPRRSSARTGCESAADMPDAIETAVALAESDVEGELSGVGVLITGSVVTVADARRLLKR